MKPTDPVLLATNTFGRLGGEINGVAHTCLRLAACFRDEGLPLEVVTYGNEDAVETDGCLTVFTHRPRVPMKIDPALRIDLAFSASAMAREMWRRRYSLVHTTSPDPLGYHATTLARAKGIPLVSAWHTELEEYVKIRYTARAGRVIGAAAAGLMRTILFAYYGRADLVIAPNETLRRRLQHWLGVPTRVLGRGVDADRFNPERRQRPREVTPRALYVGRVAREKGLQRLVPMFTGRRDVELTIVGDGPWLEEMKRRLPSVRFTGPLRGDALCNEFANADFFVFPSETDTFGNVVLEAMSSGLPVVVTDKGGPMELVRNEVDGLVTCGDAELSRAVNRLAWDPDLRARLGTAARDAARERRWIDIFRGLLRHYEEAASLRGTRNRRKHAHAGPVGKGLTPVHPGSLYRGPSR